MYRTIKLAGIYQGLKGEMSKVKLFLIGSSHVDQHLNPSDPSSLWPLKYLSQISYVFEMNFGVINSLANIFF
jgi:hypothetical protein